MTGPQMLGRPLSHRVPPSFFAIPEGDRPSPEWMFALGSTINSTPTEGTEFGTPVRLRPGFLDAIACEVVTTPGSAGAVVRLGIRKPTRTDGRTNFPGVASLVLDAGTVSAESTGAKIITISPPLQIAEPGVYFLTATVQGGASTRPTMRHRSTNFSALAQAGTSSPDLGNSATVVVGLNTSVTGALPADSSAAAQSANGPAVAVRYVR